MTGPAATGATASEVPMATGAPPALLAVRNLTT